MPSVPDPGAAPPQWTLIVPDMSDALELFFQDCGGTPPLTLQIEQERQEQSRAFHLRQPLALLGGEQGNDVRLVDRQVSRRHAYVQLLAGTAFCLDIGGRTGLGWDGLSARSGWLEPGRAVHIGPFRLRCGQGRPAPPAPWSPLAAGSLDPSAAVGWRLEASGGEEVFHWTVDRVLTLLGSSPHCKLHLPRGRTSRFHSLFFCAASRLWVVDLLSREGTYVDGERVRWRSLEDGSEIRVGSLTLRAGKEIRPNSSPAGAPADRQLQTVPAVLSSGPPVPVPTPPLFLPTTLPRSAGDGQMEVIGPQATLLTPVFQQINLMQQQMFEQMQQMMLFMAQTFNSLHQEQTASLRKELDELKRVTGELQTLQAELARDPVPGTNTAPASAPPSPAPPEPKIPAAEPDVPVGAAKVPLTPAQPGEEVHAMLTQRIAALEQERKSRWQKILSLMKG